MEARTPNPLHIKRAALVGELQQHTIDMHAAETFEEALHTLALQSRLSIGAHQSAISYVPLGDFNAAVHTHSFSEKYEQYNSYSVMPTGSGIWGLVVRQKQAVRMTQEELVAHPMWKKFSDLKDSRGLEHPPMRGWLAAPVLRQTGEVLGVIQLSDKFDDAEFTTEDLDRLIRLSYLVWPSFELQYLNGKLITFNDRLLAENAARRQAEENVRLALDAANLGTWDWDLKTGHIIWGGHHAQLLGLAPAQFDGTYEGFERCVHPEDRQAIQDAVKLARETRTPYQREYRVVWPDGSVHWLAGRGAFLYEDTGAPVRMLGAISDLTERKRAVALYQSVVDHALDAIITIDELGIVQTVNKSAEHIFGYSSAELIGQNITMLMASPYKEEHDHSIAAYRRTGQAKILGAARELEGARRKDGSVFPVRLAVSEFFLDGRRHFIGMLSDLSEKKHLESQLRHAQKMEAVGQLAGGVAHDFNNLLTVINGHSLLMLEKLKSEDPERKNFELILKAGKRAAGLTRQLLAFSRRQVMDMKVLSLNALVSESQKIFLRLLREDIQIKVSLSPSLDLVRADPGQIDQILMNLVINARDAMPRGGVLTVETMNVELDETYARLHPESKVGPHVMLAVSDTGCGMDVKTQARIFEPFFTTKELGGGTGLGLSIVFGIVKQSGGSISVYSETGKGSTFKVYLPSVAGERSSQVSNFALKPVPKGNEVILLVEDEEDVRELAREILRMNGYTVHTADNGAEALRVYEPYKDEIKLLISDVVMPQMGGAALAQQLICLNPKIKVLFISGYTDQAIVLNGTLEPGAHFLQKPFTPQSLAHKVREILDDTHNE